MECEILVLVIEAVVVYFLVLWAHSLRHRFGPVHFYALLGGITAIMSWVTDAGVVIEFAGLTFVVGSTVFYTSILLGVFVVYVFDGPRITRITIFTVAGVSIMVPLVAATLHFQMAMVDSPLINIIPMPSFRINAASVVTTLIDLVFLAMAWEYLGKPVLRMKLGLRAFLTLLGVMWLDVVLFSTFAFAGTQSYLSIMAGTFVSRLVIALIATPFLYGYLRWQSGKKGRAIQNRPVLSIVNRVAEIENQLSAAQHEIHLRIKAEQERKKVISELQLALSEIKTLRGLLPICSHCNGIRDEQGNWNKIETYISAHSDAEFSHSICPDCAQKNFPDLNIYDD